MALLELQGLCKGFDEPVIDRMDLAVEAGEFFVVVGPSGIGKTTLLRCIAGLEAPDAGRVVISGRDVTRVPPYRRRVAMTFESYALYPHLTVFENIASPLRARRLDRATVRERVHAVARLLRIDRLLDRRPGEISGGQKQRTALGRTLAAQPDVFLLDEPISHLDAKIRHELRLQFHRLEELRRTATVYVTHDYAEALSLGDRIGVMGPLGRLLQVGSPQEVFRTPSHLFVARHLGQPPINALRCELARRDGALYAVARPAANGATADEAHHGGAWIAEDGDDGGGGELALPVDPRHRAVLLAGDGREVVLGIRPQHLGVVRPGVAPPPDRHVIDGRVEVFEPLGSGGVLIAEAAGGLRLTALTPLDHDYAPGEPVRLALDAAACLYFCPERGINLHG